MVIAALVRKDLKRFYGDRKALVVNLALPLLLTAIMVGAATPTEAAGIGAMGAFLLALVKRQVTLPRLKETLQQTLARRS